jgi:hypothetical protein
LQLGENFDVDLVELHQKPVTRSNRGSSGKRRPLLSA